MGSLLGALVPVALFVYTVCAVLLSCRASTRPSAAGTCTCSSWIPVGGFQVDVGLLLDPLSMTFVLLITGVGVADPHLLDRLHGARPGPAPVLRATSTCSSPRCCCWCWPTTTSSLYVGWEGVGLASYLLIGYYYNRPSAATAAKKAFIANRVGDVGLSIAIMLMFAYVRHASSFAGVFGSTGNASAASPPRSALLLLLGACGKSGQFPLQTWLPDAMEGPTPVSALIHAATMVTAGVYLIARSHPIFDALAGRPHRGHHRRRDHPAVRLHLRLRARTT